jgi:hypothetical protein
VRYAQQCARWMCSAMRTPVGLPRSVHRPVKGTSSWQGMPQRIDVVPRSPRSMRAPGSCRAPNIRRSSRASRTPAPSLKSTSSRARSKARRKDGSRRPEPARADGVHGIAKRSTTTAAACEEKPASARQLVDLQAAGQGRRVRTGAAPRASSCVDPRQRRDVDGRASRPARPRRSRSSAVGRPRFPGPAHVGVDGRRVDRLLSRACAGRLYC